MNKEGNGNIMRSKTSSNEMVKHKYQNVLKQLYNHNKETKLTTIADIRVR